MPAPFEFLDHPADVGFLACGRTLEELFANAALAMFSLACELDGIEERLRREIEATGADTEALLYAWLAELLAVADAEQLFFRRAEVTALVPGSVRGVAYGEKF
ncbi:MAG TPA: archease, partial [Candidatus Acidoferrales bacterium]|nr:archease [Candidatus Acidoferrales bacterium]